MQPSDLASSQLGGLSRLEAVAGTSSVGLALLDSSTKETRDSLRASESAPGYFVVNLDQDLGIDASKAYNA